MKGIIDRQKDTQTISFINVSITFLVFFTAIIYIIISDFKLVKLNLWFIVQNPNEVLHFLLSLHIYKTVNKRILFKLNRYLPECVH